MIDRERIRYDIERCICHVPDACRDCSHYWGKKDGDVTAIDCMEALLAEAYDLLKEQEPITPYIDIDEVKCPVCKVKLTRQELIGDDVLFEDFFDFCPKCGKAVKWDD